MQESLFFVVSEEGMNPTWNFSSVAREGPRKDGRGARLTGYIPIGESHNQRALGPRKHLKRRVD